MRIRELSEDGDVGGGGEGGLAAAERWSGSGGGNTAQGTLRCPQCIVYEVDGSTADCALQVSNQYRSLRL